MATFLSIANTALGHVTAEPIELEAGEVEATFGTADLDPVDEVEGLVASFYPQLRHLLLNAYTWTWTQTQEALVATAPHEKSAAVPETAAWAYRYRWHRPQQLVGNLRRVYDERDGRPRTEGWMPMGPWVFTDFSPAFAVFQRTVSEEVFPGIFETALGLHLGAWLAPSLAFDLPLSALLEERGNNALNEAKRVDSQSHLAVHVNDFEYVDARVAGEIGVFRHQARGLVV